MENQIITFAHDFGADLQEKKGLWELTKQIAERKVFLSKKKLNYTAKFRIDNEAKTIVFSEYLAEKSSGLSTGGGGFDADMSPGFGFKANTYKTGTGGLEGSIKEQSVLFGKDFTYDFDYQEVRKNIEAIATEAGYTFNYKILPIGL